MTVVDLDPVALGIPARAHDPIRHQSFPNPLAGVGEWLTTGRPPPAQQLVGLGLTDWAWRPKETPRQTADRIGRESALHDLRRWFVGAFAFSIPCAEAVALIRHLGPVVEVAAGTGGWARLLTAAGVDVVATDAAGEENGYGQTVGRHHPVERLSADQAVRAHPRRAILASWLGFGDGDADWQVAMLRAIGRGRPLILLGEGPGGCCGTAAFWQVLQEEFHQSHSLVVPTFPFIHDRLVVYKRRAPDVRFDPRRLP